MATDLLIVHKKIIPDYLEKVIETREILARHEAATVTDAVKITGISRNTFYKYKNYVWRAEDSPSVRRAVISLVIKDEPGSLSMVLTALSKANLSVITISQSPPVANKATVMITLDVTDSVTSSEDMIESLHRMDNVLSAHLDAFE